MAKCFKMILIGALFTLLITFSIATSQDIIWTNNYGGSLNEMGYACLNTDDNGLVVLGSTYSYGSGGMDIYLVRTDSLGATLWAKTFGGASTENGYDVQVTYDNGYIIAGATDSYGNGGLDVYLIKADSGGNVLWTKTYGGTDDDEALSVRQAADSGFILCGTTYSYGAGYNDIYLIKTDADGDTVWTKTFGGTGGESGNSVRETADSGYIAIGSTGSFGSGYSSMYVIRTDRNGDSLWTSTYGGTKADIGYAVENTSDNGFILAGASASFGASYNDVYLVKTDSVGNVDWENIYGGVYDDRAYSVCQTADGGYATVGSTLSYGSGKNDVYVIKVDIMGESVWSNTYGGQEVDFCHKIVEDAEQDLFLVGQTYSYTSGGSDIYLLKVKGNESTPVNDDNRPKLPENFQLAQNYPNPFNLSTTIEWDFTSVSAGTYSIEWDGKTDNGLIVSSGIYFYRMQSESEIQTKKMVLIK